jgi:hypothetical protein
MLEKEFKYYIANQNKLEKKYHGSFIVIKGDVVIGNYSNEIDAYRETLKKHKLRTFLIQKCSPGAKD